MKTKLTFLFLLLIASAQLRAQAPNLTFTPIITSGLVSPMFITNCNDDRLFIVEQDGRIRIKHPGVTALDTFMDINGLVSCCGERGLLSMAFHPDYKNNGYFYVNYTNNTYKTTIARYSVNPADSNKALLNSASILLTIHQPYSNHNGGQLQFGPDGYLYIGTGDGGSANDPQNRAQNKDSLLGKMLRIDVNHGLPYTIPLDNPYVNVPNARDEIWTIGMRNPWRFSFDRLTGDLWIGDVGQGAREEIDFQKAGTGGGDNYGWRCWEGTLSTGLSGCAGVINQHPPVYEFPHTSYCSVTGGYIYRGAQYSKMFGHYFFTDYCNPQIQSLIDNGAGGYTHYNLASISNADLVSFGEDMFGELYVARLSNGWIYKIQDTTCLPVAFIASTDTLNVCDSVTTLSTPKGQDFVYQWTDSTGTSLGQTNALTINTNGWYHVSVFNLAFCSNSDSVYVNLLGPPPAASFSGLDTFYCNYFSADTLIGSPSGGVFSGAGITNSVFDPAIAGVGTYIINYEFTDANNCKSRSNSIVRVDACVSVTEISGVGVLNVYPNPVKNVLQIDLEAKRNQQALFQLTDVAGRMVEQKNVSIAAGKNNSTFDMQQLDAGVYLLHLQFEGTSLTRKIVVEK